MAPAWFIREDYLHSKLAQLIASGDTSYTNIMQVDAAIKAAGFTAYTHFLAYGSWERTSPNQYFDAHKYLDAKADQLNGLPGSTPDWNADKVALAIEDAGLTIWEHFQKYGWLEGVQPSTRFDIVFYMNEKLNQLQADEPDAGWTAQKLRDVFIEYGLSPISHYYMYGREEGRTPLPEPDPPGNTYTLTVGEDDFTGTAHNDLFKAPAVDNGTGYMSTLENIDKLDGAGGIDTLSATLMGGSVARPKIDRIEIFNLRVPEAGSATLDFINISGVQQVWNDGSGAVSTLTYDNANINTIFGVRNTKAATTVNLADTREDGTLGLVLQNAGTSDVAATFSVIDNAYLVTGLNIQAAGSNNLALGIDPFNPSELTRITVTGSGTLGVFDALPPSDSSFKKVETVDATGFTGDLTIDLSGSDALKRVATGRGDDNVAVNGTLLATNAELEISLGQGNNLLQLTGITNEGELNKLAFTGDNITLAGVTALALVDDISTVGLATLELDGIAPEVIAFGGISKFDGDGLLLANTGTELGLGFNTLMGTVDFGDEAETVRVVADGMIGMPDDDDADFSMAEGHLNAIQDDFDVLGDVVIESVTHFTDTFSAFEFTFAVFKGEALTSFALEANGFAVFQIDGQESKQLEDVTLLASGNSALILGLISDDDKGEATITELTLGDTSSEAGAIIMAVLMDTLALTTINIAPNNASWLVVDAWGANFANPVTINISANPDSGGHTWISYQADDDDVAPVRETFKYAKTDHIGYTIISDFQAGNKDTDDRIDFSEFDNVNRWEDLAVTVDPDPCGCSDSVFITAAHGQFDGVIELVWLEGTFDADSIIFN